MGLISAEQLAARLALAPDAAQGDDPIRIVDARFYLTDHSEGRRRYDQGHIPGAVFVDLHHDLADTSRTDAGRHPLPSPSDFAAVLGRLGVTPDTAVVVYDDHGGAMAARLWWMLRSVGHHTVDILDGGIGAWVQAGQSLEQGQHDVTPTIYPLSGDWTMTVTAADIGDDPDRGFTLVDSRAPERYRGDVEPLDPRAGHIPGAVNRFHGDVVAHDGRFRSADELVQRFGDLGVAPVVYCGSGVTACHNLFAMELAGIDDARLYPGSWSEWSSDPNRPITADDTASP